MRISESMIHYYLDTVTVGYFNDHEMLESVELVDITLEEWWQKR